VQGAQPCRVRAEPGITPQPPKKARSTQKSCVERALIFEQIFHASKSNGLTNLQARKREGQITKGDLTEEELAALLETLENVGCEIMPN